MLLKNKVAKNGIWIISCKIAQSFLSIIVTMLTARYLGPSNFGLINYAASIVAFVMPIMQLGLNAILVQEIVNKPEKEGETIGTTLIMTQISAFLCIIGVSLFAFIANANEKITFIVCVLYSIQLIFYSIELIQYWFQAKLVYVKIRFFNNA
jgi:O-antigen/teichoic acid export membrane protein